MLRRCPSSIAQANFTKTTFENEEGMYVAEGIEFDHIPYADNAPVLELIESKARSWTIRSPAGGLPGPFTHPHIL